MRIAFVSALEYCPWGGSEELWSGAARELVGMGHQVYANVHGWPDRPDKIRKLAADGVDVNERRVRFSDRLRAKVRRQFLPSAENAVQGDFGRWVRACRPDLICVSNGHYKDGRRWMEYARALGVPYAPIMHANGPEIWPSDEEQAALRELYRDAIGVFCVSQANLSLLERQLGERLPQARVVWNPCNVSRSVECRWPDDDGTWRLACVGRLDPDAKGQDLLFDVLARPQWRERPVKVSLFGTGRAEVGLRRLAAFHGLEHIVEFRGHVGDVADIWRHHHALVLPSRFEGLPLVLVEALLVGRPAVVTDVAGNTEVVEDDVTGFVATAPHPRLIADAMERAWNARGRWQEMGATARCRMLERLPPNPCKDFASLLVNLGSSHTHAQPPRP
jgi:glycosyltransferase involved in cell wall biosynthesis